MIETSQILETLRMIDQEKLDVRTITMGISLFNWVCDDSRRLAARVYSRITKQAENLVKVGEELEREFGVLLAAILLAGRTASSFTAQVGSMKVNEEIDALQAQGLDPMEMLVLPRVLALLVALPLLTFVAVASGMVGGAVVAVFSLDISAARYLDIIQTVSIRHFLTGIAKAPVFAFVIAIIGCLEGFKVEGSARSVGNHTTSSVVQSIFMVILLDAIAAMFFMEMKW